MFESNLGAFLLAPRIAISDPVYVSRGTDLILQFKPAVKLEQKVTLLIGDKTLSVGQRKPETAPVEELKIKISSDFPTGTFLLRLRVDGAESILKQDGDPSSPTYTQFIEPTIIVS